MSISPGSFCVTFIYLDKKTVLSIAESMLGAAPYDWRNINRWHDRLMQARNVQSEDDRLPVSSVEDGSSSSTRFLMHNNAAYNEH